MHAPTTQATTAPPHAPARPEGRREHDPRLLIPGLAGFYAAAQPVSYALLRAALGGVMVTHGVPKLVGGAHGSMADPMASAMHLIADVLRLPGAGELARFVALVEGVGGALLALGLLTRVVAPMIAVEMAVVCVALGPTWSWLDRGIEFPFTLGAVALFFALHGGGPLSVDRLLGREL